MKIPGAVMKIHNGTGEITLQILGQIRFFYQDQM